MLGFLGHFIDRARCYLGWLGRRIVHLLAILVGWVLVAGLFHILVWGLEYFSPPDAAVMVSHKEKTEVFDESMKNNILISLKNDGISHQDFDRGKKVLVVRLKDPRQQEKAQTKIITVISERLGEKFEENFEVVPYKIYPKWAWLPKWKDFFTTTGQSVVLFLGKQPTEEYMKKLVPYVYTSMGRTERDFEILNLWISIGEIAIVLISIVLVTLQFKKYSYHLGRSSQTYDPMDNNNKNNEDQDNAEKLGMFGMSIRFSLLIICGGVMILTKRLILLSPQLLLPTWKVAIFQLSYHIYILSSIMFYLYLLTHPKRVTAHLAYFIFPLAGLFLLVPHAGELHQRGYTALFPDTEGHEPVQYEKLSKKIDINDVCEIFKEKPHWYDHATHWSKEYGGDIATIMAFVYKESSFVANAKNSDSSGFGYSQALIGTWRGFEKVVGDRARHKFGDSAEFIAWLNSEHRKIYALRAKEEEDIYLVYHVGGPNFGKERYGETEKQLAKKVREVAVRYRRQLQGCEAELKTTQ